MGMVFESLQQPVMNGYLVAGAIVGPGGLQLIKELVQVGGGLFGAAGCDVRQPCSCVAAAVTLHIVCSMLAA